MNFGSERLTQGIAEAMGISEEEAEGAKITMPTDVESYLNALLMPLGRVRASIDFFDHQHDKPAAARRVARRLLKICRWKCCWNATNGILWPRCN